MADHIIANRGRYPTIQFGDTGDAVMFAQAILVWLGYLNRGSKNFNNVDGDFGLLTKSATLGFQSSEKLEIDGIIGKNTWAALLKAIEE
jgi:peptidoglycan hydrolase-like protein with peptidoglycan-binding domain